MAGYAKSIFLGRLTQDPKFSNTKTGKATCTFTLAINGRRGTKASFFVLKAWDGTAKVICDNLHKGDQAQFECIPKSESYEDRDGNTRNKVFFNVVQLTFIGKPNNEASDSYSEQNDFQNSPAAGNNINTDWGGTPDDDIPF